MATITIKNKQTLQTQIELAVRRKMEKIFNGAEELLKEQARIYRDAFANSEEYNNIKTKLVGQFGFTSEEVSRLDRILDLMVPGNGTVTISTFDSRSSPMLLLLEWVDYNKLRDHPFAQHELTKLNKDGSVISVTDVVSWIEWLENGETVAGYQFSKPNASSKGFSRSGEGIMRVSNGIFILEPTRIFEKIASEANANILRTGFGLLVRRIGRE